MIVVPNPDVVQFWRESEPANVYIISNANDKITRTEQKRGYVAHSLTHQHKNASRRHSERNVKYGDGWDLQFSSSFNRINR